MVFTNCTKTVSTTVKSKPPLVVFTVCLLGIIVTTFALAYYVHTHDKIDNVDMKDDWISLFNHLNTYDHCVEDHDGPIFKKRPVDTTSLSVLAKMNKFTSNHEMNVQGLVSLEGWSSKCPDKMELAPAQLEIEFILPATDQNTTKDKICVTLTGPSEFMPKLIQSDSCGPASNSNIKQWGQLLTKSTDKEQIGICTKGSRGKIKYDIDYIKNVQFGEYLSPDDRLMINSHLIVTSCFLVFIVVLITCYALIKSKINSAGDGKQLLTSKGMYI